MALRYGWIPSHLPFKCECGKTFSVEHELSCSKGGFPTLRHNEIQDITASLLTEVCSKVYVEPDLQPVTSDQLKGVSANSQEGARLDVSANGVWGGRFQKTYFDMRVFNPLAPSNRNQKLSAAYRKHEFEKKRVYQQRMLEVEHSSTSLVLSATRGMGNKATTFYKHLSSVFAAKWDFPYSHTLCWLRCRLSFSLLRSTIQAQLSKLNYPSSTIQAIRGARSSHGHAVWSPTAIDLITTESHIME